MAFKPLQRAALGSSSESLEDPARKLEQGLDALSSESQEQVCEFYQYVNQNCPQLLSSLQEMLAQVLRDMRRHKTDEKRLLHMLTQVKHEHHEQLRKMEEEVDIQIQKIKDEERGVLEGQFRALLRAKDSELEELRHSISRLEETVLVASNADQQSEETDDSLRLKVTSLQQENNSVKSEMSGILAQLKQMKNEMATLKQDYQEVNRELIKAKVVALDRSRESEKSSRQMAVLELANKKLRDANDELRTALEGSRNGRKMARESMSSLPEEMDEKNFLALNNKAARHSSDGSLTETNPNGELEQVVGSTSTRRLVCQHAVQSLDAGMMPGDSIMSLASYTNDENLLLKQQMALNGNKPGHAAEHPHFLQLARDNSLCDTDLESEVETNRLSSLYNLSNYQLLNTHGARIKVPPGYLDTSASLQDGQQLLAAFSAAQSGSSGVCSAVSGERNGSESESNTTFSTANSQLTMTMNMNMNMNTTHPHASRALTRKKLSSTDYCDTDVASEKNEDVALSKLKDSEPGQSRRSYSRQTTQSSTDKSRSNSQPAVTLTQQSSKRSRTSTAESKANDAILVGEPSRMFKIVLAGDSAVGKSSFLMRLCKNSFVPQCTSTVGVDFHTKVMNVDGQAVALQLWDTAGQERFRSIAKSYFRRADGVILVYDVTYPRSFLSVREWIETVSEATEKRIPILLVANKIDLRESYEKDGNRCVASEDGHRCARDNNVIFIECSAKDGTNVHAAICELARILRANQDMEVKNIGLTLGLGANNGETKQNNSVLPSCCK